MQSEKRVKVSEPAGLAAEAAAGPASAPCDASAVWIPSLISRITAGFSHNEIAGLRLVNHATASQFRDVASVNLHEPVPRWLFVDHWTEPSSIKALNRAQREKLVCLTAASNHVPNLKLALAITSLAPWRDVIIAAARAGALDSCRFLSGLDRLPGPVDWLAVLDAGAQGGHRHICAWALNRSPDLLKLNHLVEAYKLISAAKVAARAGHLGEAEWLLAQSEGSAGRLYRLFDSALRGCSLDRVRDLWDAINGPAVIGAEDLDQALHQALVSTTPDWRAKCEWLLERGAVLERSLYTRCLPHEHYYGETLRPPPPPPLSAAVERLAWLKAKGCALLPGPGEPQDESRTAARVVSLVVEEGNALALAWLLAEGVQVTDSDIRIAIMEAIRKGHLEVLQALQAAGVGGLQLGGAADGKERTLEAARSGHVRVLEWLWQSYRFTLRYGFTRKLFAAAARSGSVEAMRWVAQQGCRATKAAWSQAVESGCEAAVELLAELRCPMPLDGCPYRAAVSAREWRMLPLLWSLGVPSGSPDGRLFKQALRDGAPVATLRWLVEAQGLPLDWAEAEEVARKDYRGHVSPVLAWIAEERERQEERERAEERGEAV